LRNRTENKKSLLGEGGKERLLLPYCKLGGSGQLGSGDLTEEMHSRGRFVNAIAESTAIQSP
jgi:hypothetical protein